MPLHPLVRLEAWDDFAPERLGHLRNTALRSPTVERYRARRTLHTGADLLADTQTAHDGTRLRQVTDTADNEIPEAWSPDGTRVVVDYSRITAGTLGKGDVAVVAVDTDVTANLTDSNAVDEGHADWQP